MAEITDEMVELLKRTYDETSPRPGENHRVRYAAALSAVAPLIRAQALKEAAAIAADHRDDCAGKLSRGRKNWSDHDIAVFESAESEANSIAVAIIALAAKEPSNG